MASIGPTNNSRDTNQLREQFKNEKDELKEQYSEEINSLRKEYDRKIAEENKSGQAAVNHIQEQTKYKLESAETEAEKREKASDTLTAMKYDHLKTKQAKQEAYLDQAKQVHAKWVEGQKDQLAKDKEQTINNTQLQIKQISENNQARLQKVNESLRDQSQELQETGNKRIAETRESYQTRIKNLEERESARYQETHALHAKQLNDENNSYRMQMQKEKEAHEKYLSERTNSQKEGHNKLKEGTEKQLKQENDQSQKRIKDASDEHSRSLKMHQEKYAQSQTLQRETHEKELKRVNEESMTTIKNQKEKTDHDIKLQKEEHAKITQELNERQEAQRQSLLNRNQAELGHIQESHDTRLTTEHDNFERKFYKNQEQAETAYTNQGLALGRELINQKKKFTKAADKYTNKESDPFYQIRDSRTKFYETSGAYVFKARVPPHEKENVTVRVKGDKLTLSGNRSFNEQIAEDGKTIKTSNTQNYQEIYEIPKRVKENEIIKSYEGGTLTIIIPKVTDGISSS